MVAIWQPVTKPISVVATWHKKNREGKRNNIPLVPEIQLQGTYAKVILFSHLYIFTQWYPENSGMLCFECIFIA